TTHITSSNTGYGIRGVTALFRPGARQN
nr:envelope protein 2 variant 807 [Hepacivirus hominis]